MTQPKFELHLKIYDLNNVPLVSGQSFIKWHLAHSMHAEHRGRTAKCPVANHQVNYDFAKLVPSLRISVDRNNQLAECPLELEVLQEFSVADKMSLGRIRLNLSEYVGESEKDSSALTNSTTGNMASSTGSLPRQPSVSSSASTARSSVVSASDVKTVEDGVVRRYLMQDSKVNSTLKIGILMVQIDGDRNYVAPVLRSAPVFGSIAGFQADDDAGFLPNLTKSRDAYELQDLYRRSLAAAWLRQPSELPADECIEDIFSGGNGWKAVKSGANSTPDTDEDDNNNRPSNATLRPNDLRRFQQQQQHQQHHHPPPPPQHSPSRHHGRTFSASSDRSSSNTVTARPPTRRTVRIARPGSRDLRDDEVASVRSASLGSLAPTLGSGSDADRRADDGTSMRRLREVPESDLRSDLRAWELPGVAS